MSTNTYTNPYYNPNSEFCLEVRQWILDSSPHDDPEPATGEGLPTWNKGLKGEYTTQPHSIETKKKISEANKGRIMTEAQREKMRIPKSEEHKRKLRETSKGNKNSVGVVRSEETRKKISESLMGHVPWNKGKTGVYSEETKKRISESLKGNVPWNKGLTKSDYK